MDPGVATVSSDGLVAGVAAGSTTITAAFGGLDDQTQITVEAYAGSGFLRGEVFDDSLGLPLAGALVTLLSDGSGNLETPICGTTLVW